VGGQPAALGGRLRPTVERSRPSPPRSGADAAADVASLPGQLPALSVLVEEARSPGAARAEVDALLTGLSQPLPSEHSARERADVLLALLADEHLCDFTGSQGRTVRAAAVQALIALGYPYALELPPEALPSASAVDQVLRVGLLSTTSGKLGFGLLSFLGLLMLGPVWLAAQWLNFSAIAVFIALVVVACLSVLPAGLTVVGHNLGSRALKRTGTIWLVLAALLWMLLGSGGLAHGGPLSLIPLGVGLLTLIGTWLLNAEG
jgi:hypothetical protein